MIRITKIFLLFIFIFLLNQKVFASGEVNVYSYRQPILIDPLVEEFTNSTGIKVNVLHAKNG